MPASSPEWPEWRCPTHDEALSEVDEGLECPRGELFRVVSGVPRFVASSAYAEAFGRQWKRYRKTQLDSFTGTTISRDRVAWCLGDDLWHSLGAQVLECGCGAGRFTEVLLDQGAHVTSVDLSDAVEANRDNFPEGTRHRIAQADILRLPLPRRSFDVVFALGVVQHTPNPEMTLCALYEAVAPGGALVFDHYTYSPSWFLSIKPVLRRCLLRLRPAQAMRVVDRMVTLLLPLHARARRSGLPLERISPVVSYFRDYPELSPEMQRQWAFLDTHDALTDRYKWFRSRRQIERALAVLGLDNVWCVKGGNGVEARGWRPRPAVNEPLRLSADEVRPTGPRHSRKVIVAS